MAAPRSVRVVVELELGADPIRGRIGEPPLQFEGWLDLARALEQLRRGRPGAAAPPAGQPPPAEPATPS